MGYLGQFGPTSPFGVPVTPFMPGIKWNSVDDMLVDVLYDLEHEWGHNFLLHRTPVDDLRELTSSRIRERGGFANCRIDYGGENAKFVQRLDISVEKRADYSESAIRILRVSGVGRYPQSLNNLVLYRSTCNCARRTSTSVSQPGAECGDLELAIIWAQLLDAHRWYYVDLVFRREGFNSAIRDNGPKLDHEKIHSSIMRSSIYIMNCPTRGRNVVPFVTAPFSFSHVLCDFNNGVPQTCGASFGNGSFDVSATSNVFEEVRAWAITNRLSTLQAVPQRELVLDYNISEIPDLIDETH